jgi:ferrous iron transport protein B
MPTLVLAGQANGGKTSLFNLLTGSHFKTVNYPGATVDCTLGMLRGASCEANVLDTPGILSLVPRSEDERAAVKALRDPSLLVPGAAHPDLVLAVVDMSQPHRPLVLVRQLRKAGFPLVVVLTMPDLAEQQGCALNPVRLSNALNLPVVVVNGRTGEGLPELLKIVAGSLSAPSPKPPELPEQIADAEIQENFAWAEAVVAHARAGVSKTSARRFDPDRVLLDPHWGFLSFALVMALFFWAIFALASPLQEGVGKFFDMLSTLGTARLPPGLLADLLNQGILPGFQAVLVFVPQIAILFLLLGILEDSGYLARGTVVMDRPLSFIGLNGRSFVPLLSGFACAIPAMMAARTIPGRRERFLTLLIIPLMNCSARLPVFGLLLSLLFPHQAWKAGLAMTGIYLGSVFLGALASAALSRLLPASTASAGFQIELPSWRLPVWRTVLSSTWDRTWGYVERAGGTIFIISLLFWGLSRFPTPDHSLILRAGHALEPLLSPMGWDWRIGAGLVAAFAAREVFVSALAVVFAVQGAAGGPLLDSMRHAVLASTGTPLFTTASVLALVAWFMVSMQCLSTFAVFRKEWGSWKAALAQLLAYLGLAWIFSWVAAQSVKLF